MQTPEEIKKKDTRIRRLMDHLEKKYAALYQKVRSGDATPDEQKEYERLKSQLKVANNTG
jgi:hypothetical protein